MHPFGVQEINRLIQQKFRAVELENAINSYAISLGSECIVIRDKVIQLRNQRRQGYNHSNRNSEQLLLANGEIGIAISQKNGFLNVVFSNRSNLSFGYRGREFSENSSVLELAYALTVHKSQGSEFKKIFLIIPKNCPLLSAELLYTALTRSREQTVLLVEGNNLSTINDLISSLESETARRNTNLFKANVRKEINCIPYANNLIHYALKGHMVRSKSELVIANMLYENKVEYSYETPYEGETEPGIVLPDFKFVDAAGELVIWEHLGMLHRQDYQQRWNHKKEWYEKNGFVEGENLFTTRDDEKGGLDSSEIRNTLKKIRDLTL